ncbi:ribonuclease H-like domain-containing protein [Tanacetum coccineum]
MSTVVQQRSSEEVGLGSQTSHKKYSGLKTCIRAKLEIADATPWFRIASAIIENAKRHPYCVTLSFSSVEAGYRGVANVVADTAWIRNLLCELHTPLFTATFVYCDNVSDVYMSANPVQH